MVPLPTRTRQPDVGKRSLKVIRWSRVFAAKTCFRKRLGARRIKEIDSRLEVDSFINYRVEKARHDRADSQAHERAGCHESCQIRNSSMEERA